MILSNNLKYIFKFKAIKLPMDLKFVFLGILLFVVLVVVTIVILRKRKGSIELIPEKYNYNLGEKINGKIILKLKKPADNGKLIIGLKCEKSETNYSNGKKSSSDYILFDFKFPLENKKDYLPGEYPYDFSIEIPKNYSKDVGPIAGNIIKSINFLRGRESSLKWHLYSELNCSGVDLSKRIEINVS